MPLSDNRQYRYPSSRSGPDLAAHLAALAEDVDLDVEAVAAAAATASADAADVARDLVALDPVRGQTGASPDGVTGGTLDEKGAATWLTYDSSGGPTEYARQRLGLVNMEAKIAGGILDAQDRETDFVFGPDGHVTDRVIKLWSKRLDPSQSGGLVTTDTRVFWGHSMAWGQTNGATPLGDYLAPLLGRTVVNKGIGGETSSQIGTRMLADSSYRDAVVYLWPARNDLNKPSTSPVQAVYWIRRMLEHLTPVRRKVLIFEEPPWNGEKFGATARTGPNSLDAYNGAIRDAFPEYWVPLASWMLTDEAAAAAGITFTAADIAARETGTTPPSFLSDAGHYNSTGNRAAAVRVHQEEKNRGWS